MRKWLAMLLSLIMMITSLTATPIFAAEEVASGEFGLGGDNITWTLDSNGLLTFRGEGRMMNTGVVDSDYAYWEEEVFRGFSEAVRTIRIEDGITNISDGAFMGFTELTDVEIPDSVTSIGRAAFYNCNSLTAVVVPGGVTSISMSTFLNCYNLVSVVLPDGITTIGREAFANCNLLTDINFPNSVTSISESAFIGSGVTNIELPEGLTQLGDHAFYECSELESVILPDTLQSIEKHTFAKCSALKEVIIPKGIITIGEYVFYECDALTDVVIPSNVTTVGNNAFYGCDSLKDVELVDGVTSIGARTFYNCSSLENIIIPDSVTKIGDRAFYGCSSLVSITIPDGVTSIDDSAFWNCNSLVSATIPDSVTSIGDRAFYECNSLTDIVIPDKVTAIGSYAFYKCISLTSIEVPIGLTTVNDKAFSGCTNISDVYYLGDEGDWKYISIGSSNSAFSEATIHHNTPMFIDAIRIGSDENGKNIYSEGVNSTGHKAIYWASENDITRGYSGDTFRPTSDVTRQEMVLFLYRLAGKPSVDTSKILTFTDADEVTSNGARKAIQWAVQNGITKGYSDGSFKPEQACTRVEIAIFLYRLDKLQGREDTNNGSNTSFTDLDGCSAAAKKAIAWATKEGIIKGYSGVRKGQFGPEDNCNRQQMAIMMMRYAGVAK